MYLTYMSKCTLPGATHSIDEPRAPGLPPWKTLEHYGEPKVHKPMQSQYIPHEHTHTHTQKYLVLQVLQNRHVYKTYTRSLDSKL